MAGSADALLVAIEEWLAWSKRHKALRTLVRQTIKAEGGEIVAISMIGLLLRSPFPPIGLRPVYLKATCRYPKDSGAWFIRGTDDGEINWVWCSDWEIPKPRSKGLNQSRLIITCSRLHFGSAFCSILSSSLALC